MAAPPIRLEGFALHAGVPVAVSLAPHEGPITFGRGDHLAPLASLEIVRTDFGVTVADDRGFELNLVEHFLAALGGLGIRRGVVAVVDGPELPILDGGARAFADALARFELPREPPELIVSRPGRVDFEKSSYDFEPGDGVELEVETTFDHPAIGTQRARWDGEPRSFRDEIATARTFGFAGQAADLASRGRAALAARGADSARLDALREAVLIFDGEAAPVVSENEIARHKLLDLVGDLAFYGGAPVGRVAAHRPGHTATHRIVRSALDCGILSRR